MDQNVRIALLIDGENLSSDHAGQTLVAAGKGGLITIKRVYGSLQHLNGWARTTGFRLVHAGVSSPVTHSKNAADIALSLDALELALTRQADAFVIATSDRDFAQVAMRLTELGFRVTGIGEAKAPDDFRRACGAFVELKPKQALASTAAVEAPANGGKFEERLRRFISNSGNQDKDGYVTFSALGQQNAKAEGISKAAAGLGKTASWLDRFRRQPGIYDVDERGTASRVRLKPAGP